MTEFEQLDASEQETGNRLLKMALFAQALAYETANELENFLESTLVCGSPAHKHLRKHMGDVLLEMASDPAMEADDRLAELLDMLADVEQEEETHTERNLNANGTET